MAIAIAAKLRAAAPIIGAITLFGAGGLAWHWFPSIPLIPFKGTAHQIADLRDELAEMTSDRDNQQRRATALTTQLQTCTRERRQEQVATGAALDVLRARCETRIREARQQALEFDTILPIPERNAHAEADSDNGRVRIDHSRMRQLFDPA